VGWRIYAPILICSKSYEISTRAQQFGANLADKSAKTYIVSVFDKPHWRTILTAKDKAEAETLEQAMLQDGAGCVGGEGARASGAACGGNMPSELSTGCPQPSTTLNRLTTGGPSRSNITTGLIALQSIHPAAAP
jgi:hypothetical protein